MIYLIAFFKKGEKMKDAVLLVGAGPMSVEYFKVLEMFEKPCIVLGRGEKSANNFKEETGKTVIRKKVGEYIAENDTPELAIVAVGEASLGSVTKELIMHGVKKILVEKKEEVIS